MKILSIVLLLASSSKAFAYDSRQALFEVSCRDTTTRMIAELQVDKAMFKDVVVKIDPNKECSTELNHAITEVGWDRFDRPWYQGCQQSIERIFVGFVPAKDFAAYETRLCFGTPYETEQKLNPKPARAKARSKKGL